MNKRSNSRTPAAGVPSYIRAVGDVLDSADREYLKRKLDQKLGKFATAVHRTSVRVEDINGARGGIDKRCRIKVVLNGLPTVVVEEHHASVKGAMDNALARMERSVRSATGRRRAKSR